ncbi:MAG: transketolase [Gemmatimonadaceae bacterium]|nr:transketolase [Gemmatimonadaceae bacterium]NUQ91518.1 transketolase [Gemmatimonadaceae bacterium]NUR17961.1 transketolase [Gemmatimonadaceae bacterium]NUS96957.1 transketolase [Gemmatimonadaceae bacterium]
MTSSTSSIDQLCIDTIRTLAMDAVQKADSGHPGTPMALAPLAYALFTKHMRHNPADPRWANRDRFVLSCGHASMLLYSSLYLTGYDLTLDDLKQFRQWESRTPGHPEYGYTPGVETTTGPLGQGVGNAVGMAVAEAHLAARFNREGHDVVDHYTYFICSDGDLMEGVSHEACSFAGHFRLGKLIGFYDDNKITIDGSTDLTFTDDTGKRFEAYGWHVLHLDDVNDLQAIDTVIAEAKAVTDRPTLVVTRTHIGYGSPNRVDTAKAHGEPLGVEEVKLAKQNLGWPSLEPFFVPDGVLEHTRQTREKGKALQATWEKSFAAYRAAFPKEAAELDRRLAGKLPEGWEKSLPSFTAENGAVASRAASGTVLNALAAVIPELMGGSADLAPSNNTLLKNVDTFTPETPEGRNMHFGIREHGMGAIMNGMSLHGGVIPYGGTFLIFSDYMRPPIRLAAFMHRRVIYVYTHDSIGLGEDGPTHQPIEQLAALRCIPRMTTIRPADATETVEAWRAALLNEEGPTALVLTRQKLGFIDRTKYGAASGVLKGAYVLADAPDGKPKVVLMSSGSEVALALAAYEKLAAQGIAARVVSMPSHELFGRQPQGYRDGVLLPGTKKVAIEAAHPMSWYRWVGGDGEIIGIDRFGASAPYQTIYNELGLTVDKLVETARRLVD